MEGGEEDRVRRVMGDGRMGRVMGEGGGRRVMGKGGGGVDRGQGEEKRKGKEGVRGRGEGTLEEYAQNLARSTTKTGWIELQYSVSHDSF